MANSDVNAGQSVRARLPALRQWQPGVVEKRELALAQLNGGACALEQVGIVGS